MGESFIHITASARKRINLEVGRGGRGAGGGAKCFPHGLNILQELHNNLVSLAVANCRESLCKYVVNYM